MSLPSLPSESLSFLVPLARRNLKEQAYERLRTALIRGQFSPGTPLTVRGVAVALGISPMPVRAALERLEAEGALQARDGNRTLAVPELTIGSYQELRELRVTLEQLAAGKAAARITPAEMVAVRDAAGGMQAAADAGNVTDYLLANWRFHFGVYRASHMQALVTIIETLWVRVGAFVSWMMPDAAALQSSMPNHWELVRALERGNVEGARAAIEADILDSSEHLFRKLGGADAA